MFPFVVNGPASTVLIYATDSGAARDKGARYWGVHRNEVVASHVDDYKASYVLTLYEAKVSCGHGGVFRGKSCPKCGDQP